MITSESPVREFLSHLGTDLGRPRAVLCVSAHWETDRPVVSTAAEPETIYDFSGFPDELYRLTYPAPGAPELAGRTTELLSMAGIECDVSESRGLDHGAWGPLMLMYPEADIPVTQLSIQPNQGPRWHLEIGRRLRPLRDEGVLILASGGAVHNLAYFKKSGTEVENWAELFEDWLVAVVEANEGERLVDYCDETEEGVLSHPRDEHYLPLLTAYGAGGKGSRGKTLHRGFMDGSLSMAAFSFT